MQTSNARSTNHRFSLGILLNSIFIAVEVYYGFQANSIALIADAVHKASDVICLALVWFSYYVATRKAPFKFTYGYKNATIFAAFFNMLVLLVAIGNLLWQSFLRLQQPEEIRPIIVIYVALVGIFTNGATALIFLKDRAKDLNVMSVYLNMALDTLLSFSIVVGGLFIWWKNWYLLDPLLGFVIALTIIFSFWGLFKESFNLVLHAAPADINLKEIIKDIHAAPQIVAYHDLHVWALSTTETALSVHVVTSSKDFSPAVICNLAEKFRDKYNIHHSTIQLEVVGQGKRHKKC